MEGSTRVQETANQIDMEAFIKLKSLREKTEPCVWTEQMLTTLIKGVKRGKWYSLMDKVYSKRNVEISTESVLRNGGSPGIDNVTTDSYRLNLEHFNEKLIHDLRCGEYTPNAISRRYIPKAGSKELRPLGVPTVRDRIVQRMVHNVIEPIFENEFSDNSYGFRPGRGCKDALRQVDNLLKEGHAIVLDADIKGFFDSISHVKVMELLEKKISDGRILDIIKGFLKQEIMEELKCWTPEDGTPQGGVISPLLANIYLDGLDKAIESLGYKMVRYADDFVVMCRNNHEAENALTIIRDWLDKMELTLHPDKTRIVDMTSLGASFNFLGYKFLNSKNRIKKVPSDKSIRKFRDKIRIHTKRNNGHSMNSIVNKINPVMRGWFEYYKHSWKYVFPSLDGWVRTRLRSILRKRSKRRGIAKGSSNIRWPNKFFEDVGYFSLESAWQSKCQPLWSNC